MPETISPQPEIKSTPEQIKGELDAVYDRLIKKFKKCNPEDFTPRDRAHVVSVLESMIVRFGAENVWDGLIAHDTEESRISHARNIRFDMNKAQEGQTRCVDDAENGDPKMQCAATFGKYEPGYMAAIGKERLDEIAQKSRVDALLVGAMSHHSANEFGRFCHSLSRSAIPTVLDKSNYSLDRVDPSLVRTVHADATQMPLPDQSQDLIFTNLILPWLSKEGKLPSGEVISKVFREMARVIKDDGMVVMAETSPTDIPDNFNCWLTILLMEASLKDLGFRMVTDYGSITYKDHLSKKGRDLDQSIADQRSGKCDYCDELHYYPFSFITAADRDVRPIPAGYQSV